MTKLINNNYLYICINEIRITLTINEHLVELVGGWIEVDNPYEKGTTSLSNLQSQKFYKLYV